MEATYIGSSRIVRPIFTARRYASAVLAIVMCPAVPSVCLSVRPSHTAIVSKRLNIGSRKQHHTIAQ